MFKYIPDKTDGVITREEMVSGISFARVKPANEIGLEEVLSDKNYYQTFLERSIDNSINYSIICLIIILYI